MSLATAATAATAAPRRSTTKYVTILDAGSSATRIYIYRWNAADRRTITKVYPDDGAVAAGIVQKPGFARQSPETTERYLSPLLEGAKSFLAERASPRVNVMSRGVVPIYFLATAGMRRLDKEVQDPLLQKVYELMGEFQFFALSETLDLNVRVISGKTEGVLAWVALNYGDMESTKGLFEVGGVSAQIAYGVPSNAPEVQSNAPEIARICLPRNNNVHHVYSVSWDGFGSDSALDELRTILWNQVVEAGGARSVSIGNPCLLRGSPDAKFRGTVGTSDFPACLALTKQILAEGAKGRVSPMPYYPFIQDTSPSDEPLGFVGIANFYYTYEFFSKQPGAGFKVGDSYDRRRFEAAASKYCSGVFDGEETDFSHVWCFKAAWMLTLLHDSENGFGMSKVQVLKGMFEFPKPEKEVSWTLGAAVLIATHGSTGGIKGCQGAAPLSVGDTEKGSTFGYVPQPIITPVTHSSHPFISMSTPLAPSTDSLTNTNKPFHALQSNASIVNVAGIAAMLFVMFVFVYRRSRGTRPMLNNVELPGVKYFAL